MTRLARFRAVVAALDPTASPKVAFEQGLYVPPPRGIADSLAHRLALQPESSNLLLGHIGSGKSTTMLRTAHELSAQVAETGDLVDYIDVSERHRLDGEQLGGVLVALAGRALRPIRLARRAKGVASPIHDAVEVLRRHGEGYDEWVEPEPHQEPWEPGDDEPFDDGYVVHHRGVLVPPTVPVPNELAALVPHLKVLRRERHAVFLFDSLDRLPSPSDFREAVKHDLRILRRAGIGVVVAGPIRYTLGHDRSIHDLFDHVHRVPAPDPASAEGASFLGAVVRRRAPEEVFPDDVLPSLARGSGGVLRNLVGLARHAAEEAYVHGATTVGREHVDAAISALGDSLAFGLDDVQLGLIEKLIAKDTFVIRGEAELALVDSARILIRDVGRFEVHPALRARLTGERIAA